MSALRIILVGFSFAPAISGCWLMFEVSRGPGLGAINFGLAGTFFEFFLQDPETSRDEAPQRAWISKADEIADDLRLDGYGISSLAHLARYHDAAGRNAVLAALYTLPVDQRSLPVAARQVGTDAEWD